jgi:hypothetical protein
MSISKRRFFLPPAFFDNPIKEVNVSRVKTKISKFKRGLKVETQNTLNIIKF